MGVSGSEAVNQSSNTLSIGLATEVVPASGDVNGRVEITRSWQVRGLSRFLPHLEERVGVGASFDGPVVRGAIGVGGVLETLDGVAAWFIPNTHAAYQVMTGSDLLPHGLRAGVEVDLKFANALFAGVSPAAKLVGYVPLPNQLGLEAHFGIGTQIKNNETGLLDRNPEITGGVNLVIPLKGPKSGKGVWIPVAAWTAILNGVYFFTQIPEWTRNQTAAE